MTFGDTEPEDAWTRGDPLPELLANLARRVALLDGGAATPRAGTPRVALDDLAGRLDEWLARLTVDRAAVVRAVALLADLAYVGELLDAEAR